MKHDFIELARKRHSVRYFQDKKVEHEKLSEIVGTARTAPSAGCIRAYAIDIAIDDDTKKLLVEAAFGQKFIAEAPVILGFSADVVKSSVRYGKRGKLYAIQDATIACTYAMLAAEQLGLSSCWVGAFDEKKVKKVLKLWTGLIPIALLPIGYKKVKLK